MTEQLLWSSNGWQREDINPFIFNQKDWNQTLLDKINQAVALIRKREYEKTWDNNVIEWMSGVESPVKLKLANTVKVRPEWAWIIESLEQYNQGTKELSDRFAVLADENMPEDTILVCNDRDEIFGIVIKIK